MVDKNKKNQYNDIIDDVYQVNLLTQQEEKDASKLDRKDEHEQFPEAQGIDNRTGGSK